MADSLTITPSSGFAFVKDCWNELGVWGKRNCPELTKVVHCRNCPVYSAAAVQLLDRELPRDYLVEWTRHFAVERRSAQRGTCSVLVFRIETEWFALPTDVVQEVSEQRRSHSIPHHRNSLVLGLVNIRGELLICVSLGEMLGLDKPKEEGTHKQNLAYDRLLVVCREGSRLVFPVSEIHSIQRHHPTDLKEVPSTVAQATATYTRGMLSWDEKVVGCLDDELVFRTLNRSLS